MSSDREQLAVINKNLEKVFIDKCLKFLHDFNDDIFTVSDICDFIYDNTEKPNAIYVTQHGNIITTYKPNDFLCSISVKDTTSYDIKYVYLYIVWRFKEINDLHIADNSNVFFDDISAIIKILQIPSVDLATQRHISHMFTVLNKIQSDILTICNEIKSIDV
jgi:hypothetical protein